MRRREDKLPKTSVGKLPAMLFCGKHLVVGAAEDKEVVPTIGKCCGYQIKLATIPVSDMQCSEPLNLYFQFPNIILVGVGSCYRPAVLLSSKLL